MIFQFVKEIFFQNLEYLMETVQCYKNSINQINQTIVSYATFFIFLRGIRIKQFELINFIPLSKLFYKIFENSQNLQNFQNFQKENLSKFGRMFFPKIEKSLWKISIFPNFG